MNIGVTKMSKEEKEQIVKRNGELIELMKFDPTNKMVYVQELVENNLPLVSMMCRKQIKSRAYDEDDFQVGCIGLIKAARTFNPEKKVPFASYACFMIQRELIDAFKATMGWFDNQCVENGQSVVSLDASFDWGKDDQVMASEIIADELAALDFMSLLDDFELSSIFSSIINPILDAYCNNTTAARSYDAEMWKRLEISLILDMIEIEPVEGGMTFSKMAKTLGISVTNVRKKHESVIQKIRKELSSKNYIAAVIPAV